MKPLLFPRHLCLATKWNLRKLTIISNGQLSYNGRFSIVICWAHFFSYCFLFSGFSDFLKIVWCVKWLVALWDCQYWLSFKNKMKIFAKISVHAKSLNRTKPLFYPHFRCQRCPGVLVNIQKMRDTFWDLIYLSLCSKM